MSLLWFAAARHLPYHEVGEPSWSDDETTFSNPTDKVEPGSLGLPQHGSKFHYNTAGDNPDARVPTASLRATQDYVYGSHVRNLASLPAEAFDDTHATEPVTVVKSKSGHHLVTDGHHRAAAAIMRGDSHIRVRIEGTEA